MKKTILGLMSFVLMFGFASFANAATSVTSPSNMQGWAFWQEAPILLTSTGSMVSGPSTPPIGSGSANLIVGATGGMVLGKLAYPGTRLNTITTLEYSTYRTSGPVAVAVALQFNIDNDVTDGITNWQGRLVYEPYHTQTVNTGGWQTWNTLVSTGTGNWWGSPNLVSTLDDVCPQSNPCTWNEVLIAFPNIGIHGNPAWGAVILKAGSGGGAFNSNVDNLVINNDIYDFEPTLTPANKNECKDGGWMSFNTPTFKNQGQCVSYVVSN